MIEWVTNDADAARELRAIDRVYDRAKIRAIDKPLRVIWKLKGEEV